MTAEVITFPNTPESKVRKLYGRLYKRMQERLEEAEWGLRFAAEDAQNLGMHDLAMRLSDMSEEVMEEREAAEKSYREF